MHRTLLPDDQHLLSPSYAGEGGLNALPVAALADAGLRLVRRRNQQDVLVTKAICYADGWVDHGLIISKMRLRLQPRRRPQGRRPPGNLNIVLLNLPAPPSHVSNQLTLHLEELQVPEDDTVETRWCQLWNAIQFTVLGFHGPRISPTPGQVQQKRRSHQQPAHREVQEIKGCVDRNAAKHIFFSGKAVYVPTTREIAPLLSSDGTTLPTEKSQISKRWAEHFGGVPTAHLE
ncbi:hypothetical protein SprV_0100248300 [Sparganum proliferum]